MVCLLLDVIQRAALKEAEALRRGGSARGNESKLHRQLRIVSGSAAGKRLLSSQGAQTRPMMEKVRAPQLIEVLVC